jgi:tetratricopeptide (TPR) repeat protein
VRPTHGTRHKPRGTRANVAVWVVTLGLVPCALVARAAPVRGLTAAAQLARVYDTIFDAQFDQVPRELEKACPPAPREVCRVLDAVALWWQIQLDPLDLSLDKEFLQRINYAVASAETWTTREPQRAEAWFYLGGAYGARVQWRVLRHERLAAARDGKRIKDALEKALALDPAMHDAWFGIGLYHYYADVAPAAAKVLRWLLFLPGGDRVKGLQEMLRARDEGALLRSEADYQLQVVYLWYENNAERALELLEGLRRRHSSNPHFHQLIAEVQDVYQHDATASLHSWRALYEAARHHEVEREEMAEARARLGMAQQLDRLFETDLAIDHLRSVIAAKPAAPFGAVAQAQLRLGAALDRVGRPEDATAAYQAALALTTDYDPLDIEDRARDGLRHRPEPHTATAYRLSIEGWRALERGDLAGAERAIEQSLALEPLDPVTRYRQARLLLARKDESGALRILLAIAAARGSTPPTFYAHACVDAARLLEARGERARALDLYRVARGVFGADRRTKDAAQRALSRLSTTTPSSRR